MGSFGSPFGFFIMVKSKFLKYFLIFSSVLSLSIFTFFIPASAASFPLSFVSASYVGGSSAFDGINFRYETGSENTVCYENLGSSPVDALGVFNLQVKFSLDYVGLTGSISFDFSVTGNAPTGSSSYLPFLNVNFERPYTSGQGYSFQLNSNDANYRTFHVTVDNVTLGDYIYFRCNTYFNWSSGRFIIDNFSFKPSYSQPDSSISSGIGDVEAGESSIISGAEGDYNSQITSGNNTVLGFFNSAGNSLSFVKTMFNNLASDKIYILVIASIMLAILPVLINVAGGFKK